MSKYRKISPKIWNDSKFRSLSDNGKLVFFMLLTHPSTSSIGTLRAFTQGLAPEMGWSEKVFREAFREVFLKGMVKVSENDGLIWLPNFMKYNPPESPNVLKSWAPSLDDCPECALKDEVYHSIKSFSEGLSKPFAEAFPKAFAQPSPNQEQEQEQEQDKYIPANFDMPEEVNRFPKEIYNFVCEFQEQITEEHGKKAPKITKSLLENGCKVVDQLIRLDGFEIDEIKSTLEWARCDSFWKDNVLSIASIRKSGNGEETKFQKIYGRWEKSSGQGINNKNKFAGAI